MSGRRIALIAIIGGVMMFSLSITAAVVWRACEVYAAPPVITTEDLDAGLVANDGQDQAIVGDVIGAATIAPKRWYHHPDPSFSGLEPSLEERIAVEVALNNCHRASSRHGDPYAILYLIRMADDAGLRGGMRLFLPAVWCHESSWSWKGKDVIGDGGNSIGPMQLQSLLASFCGEDVRGDLIWSARCWIENVQRVVKKVHRICGRLDYETAEAWVSGGMKYAPRCNARSEHYDIFGMWDRMVEKEISSITEDRKQCHE